MLNSVVFPEDFTSGEKQRQQIINDILFSVNPIAIQDVIKLIPKHTTTREKVWSGNAISWDLWSVGALTESYEIRNGKEQNGWGAQGSYQRNMVENGIYYTVKTQGKIIFEQGKKIDELTSILEKIVKKDEWVNIEETVTMV